MTNGGITEGHTENSGCSDLSPVTYFGSGATPHENAKLCQFGGISIAAPPRSHYFMKKYLALLIVGASVSYGQQFNGTVFDLDSGRIQVINGTINCPQPKDTPLQTMRRINAELRESNARLSAEIAASNQLEELRRQTRLLKEIADK